MNKRGDSEVQSNTVRMLLSVSFIILMVFFIVQLVKVFQPNGQKTFSDFISAADSAKDEELFERNINLQGKFLYGFNDDASFIQVGKGDKVEKPNEPACNSGGCLCICQEGCAKPEERICKSVKGVRKFYSTSLFPIPAGSANTGIATGKSTFYIAIDGRKQGLICVLGKKTTYSMLITDCTTLT